MMTVSKYLLTYVFTCTYRVMHFENGDRLDGSFYGNYNEGMKFNGTIFKTVKPASTGIGLVSPLSLSSKDLIGRYTVDVGKKWTFIFSHFHSILGIPEDLSGAVDTDELAKHSGVAWEQLAILINQAKNNVNAPWRAKPKKNGSGDVLDGLEMIPDYYSKDLNSEYLEEVQSYLDKAIASSLHPLHDLINQLCDCFNSTYGGVRLHPRLLKHAVEELDSMTLR